MASRLLPLRNRPEVDVLFHAPGTTGHIAPGAHGPAGGAETQILLVARALRQRGLRVGIVAFGSPALPSELDGIQIIPQARWRPGRRVVPGIAFLGYVGTFRALFSVRPGLVVQRAAGMDTGIVAVLTRIRRRRFVYSSASLADFTPAQLPLRTLDLRSYRLGLRLARTLVVQTSEQRDACRRSFRREPEIIRSIAELATARRGPGEAFLWVGRAVDYKRPMEYVELARTLSPARFWMVPTSVGGNGDELLTEIRAAADEIANLEILDPRPRDQLLDLIGRAVAVVNTSEYEGLSNVLLEGWARGVPGLVLHHDPDGLIEEHGLGASAHGSPEALRRAAAEIWEGRSDYLTLSTRCRRYVVRFHDPAGIAERWAAVVSGN